MAVTQTGANGLFTRLGVLFKVVERVHTHQTDASAGLAAEIEGVLDEYDSGDMQYVNGFVDSTESWQRDAANIFDAVSRIAKSTVIGMVDDDTTLNRLTVKDAVEELIDQMGTSYDVKGNVFAVSGTGDGGSGTTGTGDGRVITSRTNGDGDTFQNLRIDKSKFVCIRDAQVTGTAGRETFQHKGELALSDIRHPDWPGGYGQTATLTVSDPSYSQQSALNRNGLANSDFEDFTTTNTPDNWTVVTGTVGTHIKEESTTIHRGSKALKFEGLGGVLSSIKQQFATAGQTTVKLRPKTRYCVSFWTRRASSVGSGVLRVSLRDSSGTAIGSGELSVTLTSDTADTWVHHSFTFSTPAVLPATAFFHVETTTAIPSYSELFIDGLQMFRMGNVTNSSSFHVAIVPGATDFVVDDYVNVAVTQATVGKMQTFFNQFVGMELLGLQLPYQTDTTETASDDLIA